MSASAMTTEKQAAMLLMEEVAVPEFARKMAADYGVDANGINQTDLRTLSDHIATGIENFLTKAAAAQVNSGASAIKTAIDVSFAVAGLQTPSSRVVRNPAAEASPYLALNGVKEAADILIAQRVEAAKQALDLGISPIAKKTEEDDEDEKLKVKPPAAA